MPFIYRPSLWGFSASAVFVAMTIIELQGSHWVEALMWGLLAVSFTVKYMPKFLIFSIQGTMISFVTLVAGGTLFFVDAADKISNADASVQAGLDASKESE